VSPRLSIHSIRSRTRVSCLANKQNAELVCSAQNSFGVFNSHTRELFLDSTLTMNFQGQINFEVLPFWHTFWGLFFLRVRLFSTRFFKKSLKSALSILRMAIFACTQCCKKWKIFNKKKWRFSAADVVSFNRNEKWNKRNFLQRAERAKNFHPKKWRQSFTRNREREKKKKSVGLVFTLDCANYHRARLVQNTHAHPEWCINWRGRHHAAGHRPRLSITNFSLQKREKTQQQQQKKKIHFHRSRRRYVTLVVVF
jgi:hypothetical protein